MGRVQNKKTDKRGPKKTLWQKLKSHTAENNNDNAKRKLFYLLSNALKGGAKVGTHVFVGMNTVIKGLTKGTVSVVCVCRDSPKALFNGLIEACALTGTPVVALPATASTEMASTFFLKKASVFALPHASINMPQYKGGDHSVAVTTNKNDMITDAASPDQTGSTQEESTICDSDRINGMIDGVRDVAIGMFTPNLLFRDKNVTLARVGETAR